MNNNSANPRKVLGRGLEALLHPIASAPELAAPDPALPSQAVRLISLASIRPNPFQPRKSFADSGLDEMAASIRESGVLQPVLLRPLPQGEYQLIAGERRWRAAQRAGLSEIPALVKPLSDEQALELAIVENLQREDLNPMDQARAFQQLASTFRLTQEQIAARTGKDRATVANFLRLLKLEPEVQTLVEEGRLSMGHARALLAAEGDAQRLLATRVAEQGWSVRQVERALAGRAQTASPAEKPPRDPNVRAAEDELCRALGTKISIKDHNNSGVIKIEYVGLSEFQRIYERLVQSVAR